MHNEKESINQGLQFQLGIQAADPAKFRQELPKTIIGALPLRVRLSHQLNNAACHFVFTLKPYISASGTNYTAHEFKSLKQDEGVFRQNVGAHIVRKA